MKNRLPAISIVISLAALVIGGLALLKQEKIVYVDSLKLLSLYKGTAKAKADYEKKVVQWKANIDTLTSELNNQIAQYEKERVSLSAREKKLSEELLETKHQQLENYRSVVAENASKEDKEVTALVFKEIGDFVKRYGEAHGYDYIMGATTIGNIVYAKTVKNITDDVLTELNKEYRPR